MLNQTTTMLPQLTRLKSRLKMFLHSPQSPFPLLTKASSQCQERNCWMRHNLPNHQSSTIHAGMMKCLPVGVTSLQLPQISIAIKHQILCILQQKRLHAGSQLGLHQAISKPIFRR